MKKLIGVFVLIALFALPSFGQGIVGVKSYDLGTIANSVDESYRYETFSGLIKQFGCNKIDSIVVSMTVDGEADVDSLDWYPVNWTLKGTAVKGTVKTFTVTLNVAAAGTGTELLLITGAGLGSALWRGYEGFGFMTRGATAGNDATDPNSCKVTLTFFGS
jgi:hypothetical protein